MIDSIPEEVADYVWLDRDALTNAHAVLAGLSNLAFLPCDQVRVDRIRGGVLFYHLAVLDRYNGDPDAPDPMEEINSWVPEARRRLHAVVKARLPLTLRNMEAVTLPPAKPRSRRKESWAISPKEASELGGPPVRSRGSWKP